MIFARGYEVSRYQSNSKIALSQGFAQREGRRRGGNTWWVLVTGEETDAGLGTWRRAVAAVGQ